MAEKIDGIALGCIAAGGGLIYAGIKGKSVPSLITGFIQGKSPAKAKAANPITQTAAPGGTVTTTTGPPPAGGNYSQAQIAQLWQQNGGAADTADFAAQVAMAESSGDPNATSANPDGGTNAGLFQLDTRGVGAGYTVAQLQDPQLNTQITIMATANGINWSAWSDPVVNSLPGHQYTPPGA